MNVEQLDLLSRPDDPDTSHAAGAAVAETLTRRQGEVLDAILHIHTITGRGATAFEATRHLRRLNPDVQQNAVAKRCSELTRMDPAMIADRGDRREGCTSKLLIVWWPTDAAARVWDPDPP